MERVEAKQRTFFRLVVGGSRTSIRTRFNHSQSKVDDWLLSEIAKQLHLCPAVASSISFQAGLMRDNGLGRTPALMHRVVSNTNVLVAALRSTRGASYRLLTLLGDQRWQPNVSVALVLEYEQAAKQECLQGEVTAQVIDDFLDFLCAKSRCRLIFYRWRPFLPDPGDDFILELAVESQSDFVITYNTKDFAGLERFGIAAVTPQQFPIRIGELV